MGCSSVTSDSATQAGPGLELEQGESRRGGVWVYLSPQAPGSKVCPWECSNVWLKGTTQRPREAGQNREPRSSELCCLSEKKLPRLR